MMWFMWWFKAIVTTVTGVISIAIDVVMEAFHLMQNFEIIKN